MSGWFYNLTPYTPIVAKFDAWWLLGDRVWLDSLHGGLALQYLFFQLAAARSKLCSGFL